MRIHPVSIPVLLLSACLSTNAAPEVDNNPDREQVVRYADFGALGNGKTDDSLAIAKAHAYANQHGLPVRADDDAAYYIGGRDHTASIQTDTHFGKARFIIDDTAVENRNAHIFTVQSQMQPVKPKEIKSLKSIQQSIRTKLQQSCVVCVTDSGTRQYIRKGLNQNAGSSQTDVFLMDQDGKIDPNTPILWNFNQVTDIMAYPVDPSPLKITGGRFITVANAEESKYNYYARGILIRRSNVHVSGIEHRITGEGNQGAPYKGFINITDCANVTISNTTLSGHKTYRTIGRAGKPVSMGTYDINVTRALNVSFINCRQFNDIKDRSRWGIMASNYSKNLLFDRCELSRFDAHKGVAGATIRNSTLGHAGINIIGSGTFTVESTTVYGTNFINLREDYGSTWQGDFIIKNCTFVPACGRPVRGCLIGGANDGQHDFGYTCYMPENIHIDGLHIDDSSHPDKYQVPAIFADFNPRYTHAGFQETHPYIKTKKVILKNISTASGKPLHTSSNQVMFRNIVTTHK